MKRALLILAASLLLTFPSALVAQFRELPAEPPPVDTRPTQLYAELSKLQLTATRDIPASDGLFIEEDSVVESLYFAAAQDAETVVPAGKTTVVSKVELDFGALTVFAAKDACVLLIMPKDNKPVEDMTLEQLKDLARKGLSALFAFEGSKQPARRPT